MSKGWTLIADSCIAEDDLRIARDDSGTNNEAPLA